MLGAAPEPGWPTGHDGPDNRRRKCLDPAHVVGLVVLRRKSGAVVHSHRADALAMRSSLVGRVFSIADGQCLLGEALFLGTVVLQ